MKTSKITLLGLASLIAAALSAQAGVTNETFRTTAFFYGVTQGTNDVTGRPRYEQFYFAGHNLVNLAMGRSFTATNVPNQVLAMTFACDLSSASLVVYDEKDSNIVATIAPSTAIDSVVQQDTNKKDPSRAHFVAVFQLSPNGNPTNGLAGGYFTIAGRVNLNPETGCPQPVAVVLDHDPLDGIDGEAEIPARDDPDSVALTKRTGLAHAIGVVDAVTDGGTNTVLVPLSRLSVRRELPVAP